MPVYELKTSRQRDEIEVTFLGDVTVGRAGGLFTVRSDFYELDSIL